MWENIRVGLQLTLFGTGLVFMVLAFLWGLMWLLLALDVEKVAPTSTLEQLEEKALGPSPLERALIALAVLRHRQTLGKPSPEGKGTFALTNTWITLGRLRQLRSWHPGRGEE